MTSVSAVPLRKARSRPECRMRWRFRTHAGVLPKLCSGDAIEIARCYRVNDLFICPPSHLSNEV
jgi:hypothetical protein